MVLFTGSDLFGKCWQVVYNVISGNVLDPTSRGGSRWIFADFPTIQVGKEDNFPGYPIITIDNFGADSSNVTWSTGGLRGFDLISTISVHTKSRNQVDTLKSAVEYALSSKRGDLLASGLRDLFIGTGDTSTEVIDRNNKIHTTIIPIRFKAEL